jgi:Secretion system C-terminal sorting domain
MPRAFKENSIFVVTGAQQQCMAVGVMLKDMLTRNRQIKFERHTINLKQMKTKLLIASLFFAICKLSVNAQDTVAVNSSIQYQTITGWGHGGGVLSGVTGPWSMIPDTSIANPVNREYLDQLVDDLGLTGSRTWEVGPRVDGTGMDNGDCDSINWSLFQSNSLPTQLANYLIYYKNKILAKGYQPNFYSSPGYPTHATDQKPWIMYHPGERAQQIWASALYMHNTYGIDINYDVIYNEPSGSVTSTVLADDVKALGPRLVSHGLTTKSQFAEAIAPQTDWNFITPVQTDSSLWYWTGRLSYHNYGTSDPYRNDIYNFGLTKGLTTAQTEMGNPGFDDIYNDMTLGNTSYWEVGYSANTSLANDTGLTAFTPSATYFRMRQVMHYVTPGSVRISATTGDANIHVMSFNKGGAVTTVLSNANTTTTNVTFTGLPPGTYGVSRAQPSAPLFYEVGLQTVGVSGSITLPINGGSWVTTLYPYVGPNHPPTIMTFVAHPGYLVLPASSTTLSAQANDAELDPLTHTWTVMSSPVGSTPAIANPNAYNTAVTGLTVAGNYVFNIAVSDGTNTTNKQVYVEVYTTNPQPVMGSAGFRISTPYGLVFGNPGDTTHANIELPTSSLTTQLGISDLANSDFTGRGTWTIVSQPTGGVATISATTYIYVSIRANVTGMTVPGDYVFQVNVTNPGHPDLTARIICTVHPASLSPVINSITPSPAILTLPTSSSLLTAVTSDPEGDLLRHWWYVTSAPIGAYPVFDHQGLPISTVSGLTVAGTYVFTLRCFDDLHMTTQNITIVVNPAVVGINNPTENNSEVHIYPNPFTYQTTIAFSEEQKNTIIKITDVVGKEIKAINFTGRQLTLTKGEMQSGIYFVQTIDELKHICNRKIIIQ